MIYETGNKTRESALKLRKWFLTIFLITNACVLVSLTGCQKEGLNRPRGEFIDVYASLEDLNAEKQPIKSLFVPVAGGLTKVYVKSNVTFNTQWQNSTSIPWGKVVTCDKIDEQVYSITLKVLPRSKTSAYYTKRTAMLMLGAKELDFNCFITVYQGLTARLGTDFSWLKYGTDNPLSMDGTPIDEWKDVDIEKGYESTVMEDDGYIYAYGKNGYIQLGDDNGHIADIITPFAVGDIRNDSLLVLTLNAVAFSSPEGNKDINRLKIEVLDGGVIRDYAEEGKTFIEFNAEYYDAATVSGNASAMWDKSELLIGIASTSKNPITANTRIRITALDQSGNNSRIFIDNIYLRRIYYKDGLPVDEDLYLLNGGSGPDRILGARDEFPDDIWVLN